MTGIEKNNLSFVKINLILAFKDANKNCASAEFGQYLFYPLPRQCNVSSYTKS